MSRNIGGLGDAALFILVTLPAALFLILTPFCNGDGNATEITCSLPVLVPIAHSLYGYIFLMGIFGLLALPIALFLLILSGLSMVSRWRAGNLWSTPLQTTQFLISLIPFVLIISFLLISISAFGFE